MTDEKTPDLKEIHLDLGPGDTMTVGPKGRFVLRSTDGKLHCEIVGCNFDTRPQPDTGSAVTVKPLEWVAECDFHCLEVDECETPLGKYSTFKSHDRSDWSWMLEDGPACPEYHGLGSMGEAKEAAQADYERRILSAIQPAPTTDTRAYDLAYAIAGGEDAPGLLDSIPTADLVKMIASERAEKSGWMDVAASAAQAEALQEAADICKAYAAQMGGLAIDGLPEKARCRESMEATATKLKVKLLALIDTPPPAQAPTVAEAAKVERDVCAHRARQIANIYDQGTDGRNTFTLLADQFDRNDLGGSRRALSEQNTSAHSPGKP